MVEAPTVIVAGMHRSGTSLVASFLADLGIDMGRQLLPGDRHNQPGYFEDKGFLELNSRILTAATAKDDGGHPDWGWTESRSFDRSLVSRFEDEAVALYRSRAVTNKAWGWKDPRNTLLLDFWDGVADKAVYILVYRLPWEVSDSMQRLGADVFLDHPEYALSIWGDYNRQLLEFYGANENRCLLVSVNALVKDPDKLARLLRQKLQVPGIEEIALHDRYSPELLLQLGGEDPLIRLIEAAFPECTELLGRLDDRADVSGRGLWESSPGGSASHQKAATEYSSAAPVLSVVIPCLDQGDWLLESIASVERSLQVPYELIVVNDGSRQSRTLGILQVLEDLGYRILHQANSGLSAARNQGIDQTRGPLILPLDADNRLRPGFAEEALALLGDLPEVGVVYGDRWEFGKRSGVVNVFDFDLPRLLRANYIDACAIYRREVWRDVGGYDEEISPWEDWDFWIGAADKGWRLRHLPGAAFDYRVRPTSLVSSTLEPTFRETLVSRVIRKHEDLYKKEAPRILLTAESELIVLRDQIEACRRHLKAEADELRQSLSDLLEQLQRTQDHERRLARYARDLEKDLRAKQIALDEAASYAATLLDKVDAITLYAHQLETETADKQAALEDATSYATNLLREMQSIENYAQQLDSEVVAKQTAIDQAAAHAGELERHQDSLAQYIGKLEAELQARQETIDRGADHASALDARLQDAKIRLREMTEAQAESDRRLAEMRDRLVEKEAAIERRDDELENIYSSPLWRITGLFRRNRSAR